MNKHHSRKLSNMYKHELKAHYRGLIGWSIGMLLLIFASMNKYAAYKTSGQSITDLISQFPHTIQVIFGINGLDISSPIGYFGTMYLYILVVCAIYAAMRGADIVSKEDRDKTTEFLLPKPVSRHRILWSKLLAATTFVVFLWIITTVLSLFIVGAYSKGIDCTPAIRVIMLATLVIMLIFMSIGIVIGSCVKKAKLAVTISSSIVLASYILAVIINLSSNLSWLRYVTPIAYFQAPEMLRNLSLNINYLVLSAAIIVISLSIAFFGYNRRNF